MCVAGYGFVSLGTHCELQKNMHTHRQQLRRELQTAREILFLKKRGEVLAVVREAE